MSLPVALDVSGAAENLTVLLGEREGEGNGDGEYEDEDLDDALSLPSQIVGSSVGCCRDDSPSRVSEWTDILSLDAVITTHDSWVNRHDAN